MCQLDTDMEMLFSRSLKLDDEGPSLFNVWSFQHWMAESQRVRCTVAPMGLAECRMLLNGEDFLLCFPIDKVPGTDLKGKLEGLQNMGGEDLSALVKEVGWLHMHSTVGSTVVVPSGFIIFSLAGKQGSDGVRWSYLRGQADAKRVRDSVQMFLQSFVALRSTVYTTWKEVLDNAVEATEEAKLLE